MPSPVCALSFLPPDPRSKSYHTQITQNHSPPVHHLAKQIGVPLPLPLSTPATQATKQKAFSSPEPVVSWSRGSRVALGTRTKKNQTFYSSVFALLATRVSLAFRASFSAKNEVPKEEAKEMLLATLLASNRPTSMTPQQNF